MTTTESLIIQNTDLAHCADKHIHWSVFSVRVRARKMIDAPARAARQYLTGLVAVVTVPVMGTPHLQNKVL